VCPTAGLLSRLRRRAADGRDLVHMGPARRLPPTPSESPWPFARAQLQIYEHLAGEQDVGIVAAVGLLYELL
jgi:hypothetical protein